MDLYEVVKATNINNRERIVNPCQELKEVQEQRKEEKRS